MEGVEDKIYMEPKFEKIKLAMYRSFLAGVVPTEIFDVYCNLIQR